MPPPPGSHPDGSGHLSSETPQCTVQTSLWHRSLTAPTRGHMGSHLISPSRCCFLRTGGLHVTFISISLQWVEDGQVDGLMDRENRAACQGHVCLPTDPWSPEEDSFAPEEWSANGKTAVSSSRG